MFCQNNFFYFWSRWDRQWAVMQNGRVLTQKKEPILAQIQVIVNKSQTPCRDNLTKPHFLSQPTIDTSRGLLTLSCQGEGEVSVPLVRIRSGPVTAYINYLHHVNELHCNLLIVVFTQSCDSKTDSWIYL